MNKAKTELLTHAAHSTLGASAAERWMECPGSNVIINELDLPPSEESDFAKEGTAAHEAAAHCERAGLDAWEIEGQTFLGYVVDREMVDAIQDYLDEIARLRAEHLSLGNICKELTEYRVSGDFHPLFFGTVDKGIVGEQILDVIDLKYGAGIAVDAYENKQLKYYAVGILEKFIGPLTGRVRLTIVQPRAYHEDGPIRSWETTFEELIAWKKTTLIPAMNRAEIDTTLTPGDHCRFCPAKIVCPVLTAIFGASVKADASALVNLSDTTLALDYSLIDASKHYWKAVEAEVFRRLNRGDVVSAGETKNTFKLVPQKANRVFSPEAVEEAKKLFTQEELFVMKMATPAQIDKLGTKGKKFTKEFAYTPYTGLTVAPADDPRVGVKIASAQETYAQIAAAADPTAPPNNEGE